MLRGNANEIVKGKANQRDKESTDHHTMVVVFNTHYLILFEDHHTMVVVFNTHYLILFD